MTVPHREFHGNRKVSPFADPELTSLYLSHLMSQAPGASKSSDIENATAQDKRRVGPAQRKPNPSDNIDK